MIALSFASRLRRGQDVLAILRELEGYNPPRQEESLEYFQNFLDALVDTNNTETQLMDEYRSLVAQRKSLFYTGPDSVTRLFSGLKYAAAWQYGHESIEFKLLDTIWGRMINYTTVSVPTSDEATSEVKKPRRNSEKSYAAMTKNFTDYVTIISGFKNYSPGPEKFKLESLNSKLAAIYSINNAIATKKSQLISIKKERLAKYRELKDRTNRIKQHISSKYGADSDLYHQIYSMKF
jgi:hypothetical protein